MSQFRLPKLDTLKSFFMKKVERLFSFIFKTNRLQSHQRPEVMPGFGSISHPSHVLPHQTSHLMDQGVKHERKSLAQIPQKKVCWKAGLMLVQQSSFSPFYVQC